VRGVFGKLPGGGRENPSFPVSCLVLFIQCHHEREVKNLLPRKRERIEVGALCPGGDPPWVEKIGIPEPVMVVLLGKDLP